MAIKANTGPIAGREVMHRELAARAPQAATFSTPLGGAPQAGSPIPVYHLSMERLNDRDPLAEATITSWRYPIVGGIQVGFADIRASEDGATATFGGLSHGIFSERFIQASLLAERTLADRQEDFQPRLLDMPALQFAALWLHGDRTQYFISLLDGRPQLSTAETYR